MDWAVPTELAVEGLHDFGRHWEAFHSLEGSPAHYYGFRVDDEAHDHYLTVRVAPIDGLLELRVFTSYPSDPQPCQDQVCFEDLVLSCGLAEVRPGTWVWVEVADAAGDPNSTQYGFSITVDTSAEIPLIL